LLLASARTSSDGAARPVQSKRLILSVERLENVYVALVWPGETRNNFLKIALEVQSDLKI
jgi:hypothetical protein